MSKLELSIPLYTSAVSPAAVLGVGATGLRNLAGSNSTLLLALREAYADAIQDAMIYAVAGVCVALPFACGMQWFNIKRVAKQRREATASTRCKE